MSITDSQLARVLQDITVIVDTREQKNQHILEYLKDNNIPYIKTALSIGDYSLMLPHYPEIGVDKKFLVERKNSLNEIASNMGQNRDRFMREFERITDETIHLVIENASWTKILNHSYRSKLPPKSFMANLMTISIRYGCPTWFTKPEYSGEIIYHLLRYELREYLKNNRNNIIIG